MKTTTFSFGILLAAILLVTAWSSPVQGRDAAAGPEGNRPLYPLAGQICENAHVLLGPMPYNIYGGTAGRGDDYNLDAAGECAGGGVQSEGTGLGEDDVLVFSTDMDCPIAITMTPQGPYDLALYVLSTNCNNVAGNCLWVDDGGGAGGVEELEIMALGGQYYFVIVDGYGGQSGDYTLDLNTSGECSFVDRYGEVGDRLWLDENRDGIQNEGEGNLNLGLVNLYGCGGPFIQAADLYIDTDYEFGGLLPGEYYVEFVLPAGYRFSPRDQGEDDTQDSDADLETGQTACFWVGAETHDMTRDAGAYPQTFTLGDRVWYDTDWDGIQDPGESGLEGVQMGLLTGSCDPTSGPVTASDASGFYAFGDVVGGTYCINVHSMPSTPGTWVVSPRNVGGDDTLDSDFSTRWWNTGLLSVSADSVDLDLGVYVEGYIGGWVWCDTNGNQVRDAGEGVENVKTQLYADPECDMVKDSLLDQYLTEADGWYDYWDLRTGPPGGPPECYVVEVDPSGMGACTEPLVSTSKAIAVDASSPSWPAEDFGFREPDLLTLGDRVWYDTDVDGIQEQGEPGLEGVDLTLYLSSCGASAPATTTSDALGAYAFGGLAPGSYCIEMTGDPATPGPWYISPTNAGDDDTLDSDFSPLTGTTGSLAVSAGNPHVDLGMYTLGAIGGRVWCDANDDGSFDAGEGMAGAFVNVYADDNCDTVKNARKASHSTGSGGVWLANALPTGPPGGPAVCYVLEVDPDFLGACSEPLGPSEEWFALVADSPQVSNVSFGFRTPEGLSLGDRVWYDTDQDGIQDAAEPGVKDVGVELYGNGTCQGSPQASDTTSAAGLYGFSGLTSGTYCLSFASGIPAPFYLTTRDAGSDDSLDSDVDTGTKRIENISLSTSNQTYDAGLRARGKIEGRVFCDYDGDDDYDLDELVDGVTVRLFEDANCDTSKDDLSETDVTVTGGFFGFNPVRVGPPGGPPLCYVLQVDVAGMGACNTPLTSNERSLALTVENRRSLQNNIGFSEEPAMMRAYLPLVMR